MPAGQPVAEAGASCIVDRVCHINQKRDMYDDEDIDSGSSDNERDYRHLGESDEKFFSDPGKPISHTF